MGWDGWMRVGMGWDGWMRVGMGWDGWMRVGMGWDGWMRVGMGWDGWMRVHGHGVARDGKWEKCDGKGEVGIKGSVGKEKWEWLDLSHLHSWL